MTCGKKHINIPVFIPHLGCPNQCVFCDQRAISGTCSFIKEDVPRIIDQTLTTINREKYDCEIAFFGGSFTGIDRACMRYCLDNAQDYVNRGSVCGIRMSTRPDYIDEEILSILSEYTVSEVELGIQSFSDDVLRQCKRGHTAADTVNACALLRSAGIPFVGQMMIGLPGSSAADEVFCAERICALGASGSRIYPTIVFQNTTLKEMAEEGSYTPLSIEEAVERSAAALEVLIAHGVPCLRIGLCESENLHSDAYYAGPNHPALGSLVREEVYYRGMCRLLNEALPEGGGSDVSEVVFSVPRGDISLSVGQKKRNKLRIENKFHVKSVRFIENDSLIRYNIKIASMH